MIDVCTCNLISAIFDLDSLRKCVVCIYLISSASQPLCRNNSHALSLSVRISHVLLRLLAAMSRSIFTHKHAFPSVEINLSELKLV